MFWEFGRGLKKHENLRVNSFQLKVISIKGKEELDSHFSCGLRDRVEMPVLKARLLFFSKDDCGKVLYSCFFLVRLITGQSRTSLSYPWPTAQPAEGSDSRD